MWTFQLCSKMVREMPLPTSGMALAEELLDRLYPKKEVGCLLSYDHRPMRLFMDMILMAIKELRRCDLGEHLPLPSQSHPLRGVTDPHLIREGLRTHRLILMPSGKIGRISTRSLVADARLSLVTTIQPFR